MSRKVVQSAVATNLLRGVFAGAGSDGFNEPAICDEVMRLSADMGCATPSSCNIVYLGTATYDLPAPRLRQTQFFAKLGCNVHSLDVAIPQQTPTQKVIDDVLASAHVVIVSGGNTLYAIDRWHETGVTEGLRQCAERGVILAGGSAGAICWFDGGHSDSADPDTFKSAMLQAAAAAAAAEGQPAKDEASAAPATEADRKRWDYIRVSGLGFLRGLVCPHYDRVQSNGVLRARDFDMMMARHPQETGICIDHWAALVVDRGNYRVVSVPGKTGSGKEGNLANVQPDGSSDGFPAVIVVKTADEGAQREVVVLPSNGPIARSALDFPSAASSSIVVDPREEECRQRNPTQSK